MPNRFASLAINNPDDLLFGHAPHPLRLRSGMVLGAGTVYPEINFTLPTMAVDASTMNAVEDQYREMITGVLRRAVELEAQGLLVEFETLPPMTEVPDWGMRVTQILLDAMAETHEKCGLKSSLRMTPNDTREMVRPPVMRSGELLDAMLELFDRSSAAGAELLSIESVGGKEVHDEALMTGDLQQAVFALCVMGVRDMRFLWTKIADIAAKNGAFAAGDTACGFGNTAMVLAEQKMIPRVFSAVIRCITTVRSLVAYECGAVGPGKDCGYENIFLKAITGFPMANEGKSATCAHLSPVGNIAAAACDTWSNESVQNVKLLGAMAPVCSLESLVYDCRLFNQSIADGKPGAHTLRDWLVRSDAKLDPQAYILVPENVVRISQAIVDAPNPYRAGVHAGLEAVRLLSEGHAAGHLQVAPREQIWLETMRESLEELPQEESEFINKMMAVVDTSAFIARDYDLA